MKVKTPTFSLNDSLRNTSLHWGQFVQDVIHLAKKLEVVDYDDHESDHPLIKFTVSLLQGSVTEDHWESARCEKKIKCEDSYNRSVLNCADWDRIAANISRKCVSINF